MVNAPNTLPTKPSPEARLNAASPPNAATSPYAVEHLSDAELLAGTRGLVARSNQQLARLLAHLAEVEARGIHRARACSSLYTYGIYELRLSEDTAFRYARAAKIARQFPVVFEHLAAGEIHLTGLLLLAPHLTDENHREVLQLAKHRSKRELTKLVRRLDPLPDVPARIEPLGPARTTPPHTNATWGAFMQALNPVRELTPAERPSNWLQLGADAESEPPSSPCSPDDFSGEPARSAGAADATDGGRDDQAPWLNPQRYSIQFTANQEYVDLVERAKDLLSHAMPNRSLDEIHLRAMRLLVAELEKRKFAVGPRPRSHRGRGAEVGGSLSPDEIAGTPAVEERATNERDAVERDTNERELVERDSAGSSPAEAAEVPRRRGEHSQAGVESPSGRYIPADVRREVRERDAAQCAYLSADGQRCQETSFLEIHHEVPYARGGLPVVENLALHCRSHNALAAEQDFGRAHMARRSGRE